MMSHLLEKAMRTEWRSPFDFCRFLELSPTTAQSTLLERFYDRETDFGNDEMSIRGLCVCLLWDVLSNPGQTTVLVGNSHHRTWAMQFITGLLQRSQALVEVTNTTRWGLTFGSDPGWSIRAVHENPGSLTGLGEGATVVVLGAAEDWAIHVEQAARGSGARVVRTF